MFDNFLSTFNNITALKPPKKSNIPQQIDPAHDNSLQLIKLESSLKAEISCNSKRFQVKLYDEARNCHLIIDVHRSLKGVNFELTSDNQLQYTQSNLSLEAEYSLITDCFKDNIDPQALYNDLNAFRRYTLVNQENKMGLYFKAGHKLWLESNSKFVWTKLIGPNQGIKFAAIIDQDLTPCRIEIQNDHIIQLPLASNLDVSIPKGVMETRLVLTQEYSEKDYKIAQCFADQEMEVDNDVAQLLMGNLDLNE